MTSFRQPLTLAPHRAAPWTHGLVAALCTLAWSGCANYLETSPKKDDSADSKKSDTEEPTPEPSFKASSKKLRFKLKKELSKADKKELRLVVQPGLGLLVPGAGLGEALVDVPAKFKDRRMSVKVPPIDKDVDLGRGGFALLLSTLYQDLDESGDFSKGDVILASAKNMPVYARRLNRPRVEEWTRFEFETQALVEIKGSIVLERVDGIEQVDAITFSGLKEDVAKGINLVATLSIEEQVDLPTNFNKAPRPFEVPFQDENGEDDKKDDKPDEGKDDKQNEGKDEFRPDEDPDKDNKDNKDEDPKDEPEKEEPKEDPKKEDPKEEPQAPRFTLNIDAKLDEGRWRQDEQPIFDQIGPVGLELLGGFKSDTSKLSESSERVALGCIRNEEKGRIFYEPVAAFWIEPSKTWIEGPTGAFLALAQGLNPGWNRVRAIELRPGEYTVLPLPEEKTDKVGFYKDCRFAADLLNAEQVHLGRAVPRQDEISSPALATAPTLPNAE